MSVFLVLVVAVDGIVAAFTVGNNTLFVISGDIDEKELLAAVLMEARLLWRIIIFLDEDDDRRCCRTHGRSGRR